MIYNKLHGILEKVDGWLIEQAVEPSKVYQVVNGGEVGDIVSLYPMHKRILDSKYRTYTKKELTDTLKFYNVDGHKYIKQSHDCDDFAYEVFAKVRHHLSGCMFGVITGRNKDGGAHAWNFFIDNDFNVWHIEPQNNTFFRQTTEIIWDMVV